MEGCCRLGNKRMDKQVNKGHRVVKVDSAFNILGGKEDRLGVASGRN